MSDGRSPSTVDWSSKDPPKRTRWEGLAERGGCSDSRSFSLSRDREPRTPGVGVRVRPRAGGAVALIGLTLSFQGEGRRVAEESGRRAPSGRTAVGDANGDNGGSEKREEE